MLLVLSAVEQENQLLRCALNQPTVEHCGHLELHRGQVGGQSLLIATCGIGKSSAAASTALLVNHYQPELVCLIGCAGAYPGSQLTIGDLAVASAEIHADEGVCLGDAFLDMAAINLPLVNNTTGVFYNQFPVAQPLSEQLYAQLQSYCSQQRIGLGHGPFATVSSCSGTLALGQRRRQRTGALTENMEGAAVAQICTQLATPFVEVRAISNLVEDRNMDHWDLPGAMATAQQALLHLLKQPTPLTHNISERTSCNT